MARPRQYESDDERRAANAARMREARSALAHAESVQDTGVSRTLEGVQDTPPGKSHSPKPVCAIGDGLPQDTEARRIAAAWQHEGARHGVEVSMDSLLAAVARGRAAVTRDDVQAAKRLLGKSTSTCLENQST